VKSVIEMVQAKGEMPLSGNEGLDVGPTIHLEKPRVQLSENMMKMGIEF
jgi:hypothetical protein